MPKLAVLFTSLFVVTSIASRSAAAEETLKSLPSAGKLLLACGEDEGLRANGLRKLTQHVYIDDAQSDHECDPTDLKNVKDSGTCHGVCLPLMTLSPLAQHAALRVYDDHQKLVTLTDAQLSDLVRRYASELHAQGFANIVAESMDSK